MATRSLIARIQIVTGIHAIQMEARSVVLEIVSRRTAPIGFQTTWIVSSIVRTGTVTREIVQP